MRIIRSGKRLYRPKTVVETPVPIIPGKLGDGTGMASDALGGERSIYLTGTGQEHLYTVRLSLTELEAAVEFARSCEGPAT